MCLRENLSRRWIRTGRPHWPPCLADVSIIGADAPRAGPYQWRIGKSVSQGRHLIGLVARGGEKIGAQRRSGPGCMQWEIGTLVTHSAAWAGLFEWRLMRRKVGGRVEGGGGRLCLHA